MNEIVALLDTILSPSRFDIDDGREGAVWMTMVETGLHRVGTSEDLGGSGGSRRTASTILTRFSESGINSPLSECLFPVAYLAERTGAPLPAGVVSASIIEMTQFERASSRLRILGNCSRVPWGASSDELWVLASLTPELIAFARLDPSKIDSTVGWNIAKEPRDHFSLDISLDESQYTMIESNSIENFLLFGAFGRSCQMLGAMRSCLQLSCEYASSRRQFQKTLSSFQAIQHLLAQMACEVAAAESAVSNAAGLIDCTSIDLSIETALGIASAKVQTSNSATKVSRIAHQIHGAMGLTEEYPLHRFSTQLWSWREEFGSANYWSIQIIELLRRTNGSSLWNLLTAEANSSSLQNLKSIQLSTAQGENNVIR